MNCLLIVEQPHSPEEPLTEDDIDDRRRQRVPPAGGYRVTVVSKDA